MQEKVKFMPPAKKKTSKPAPAKKANVHLFIGNDSASVKQEALAKVQQLAEKVDPDFGLEVISGVAENAESAAQICQQVCQGLATLPFLGDGKVVWLKGVQFLSEGQVGRAAQTQEAWEKVVLELEKIPAEVHFIFSGEKPDRRRTSWKSLEKMAKPSILDLPDTSRSGWQQEVALRVRKRAQQNGFSFEREALELFVHLAGEDTQTVESEVDKMGLSLAEGAAATEADVRVLVANSRAGVIFEIGDAIGKQNLAQALQALRHFTARNESPIGLLLAAIVPKVRNLLVAAELRRRHRFSARSYSDFQKYVANLPEKETSFLPRTKAGKLSVYPLFLALKEVEGIQPTQLRKSLSFCLEANRKLVSTNENPELVLVELLTHLCLAS